jgi:hypothetical protein
MRKRQLTIAAAVVLLVGGSLSYIAVGMRLYARYRTVYAGYDTACGNLITWAPPAEIYSAFYASQPSLVTLRYRSPTPQELEIGLSIPQFTQVQRIQVNAGPAFQQVDMKPPLIGSAALDALVGARQRGGQVDLTVQGKSGTLCDTSIPVVLKSRQWMHWFDPVNGDNSRYLAGWVTPQDPTITTLIGRTAHRLGASLSIYEVAALTGYDEGRATADQVRSQVDAIFDTLQFDYHLRYAEDNVPYDRDAEQLIQLPHDILSDPAPAGMCLETTAILASAVEHLGMRPYFVIVPGHAFLGVALGAGPSAPIAYWETSDLNGGIFGTQANEHGNLEYTSYQSQHEVLRVVDVESERAQGIAPIE